MDTEKILEGLEKAKQVLMDKVPVLDAWDAIKAVTAAIGWMSIKEERT